MKEIDFLPKWYTAGKQRRVNYRRQYIIIAGIFVTLIAWSFSADISISVVEAQVEMMHTSLKNNEQVARRYTDLQNLVDHYKSKDEVLERLDTGVKISGILAELSYLIGENITLTKLDYSSEVYKFADDSSRSSVRLGKPQSLKNDSMPDDNVRFKIVMKGIAENSADVTAFIARLEASQFLCQIIPGTLKNVKDTSIADFEVSCYVANYTIE